MGKLIVAILISGLIAPVATFSQDSVQVKKDNLYRRTKTDVILASKTILKTHLAHMLDHRYFN